MRLTKLTSVILGEPVYGETPVKRKKRKRLSVTFYQNRARKGWDTRKRLAQARSEAEAADDKRAA